MVGILPKYSKTKYKKSKNKTIIFIIIMIVIIIFLIVLIILITLYWMANMLSRWFLFKKLVLTKFFLTGILRDRFKLIYVIWDLRVSFFIKVFIEYVSLKQFYWYIKLFESSQIFKQRNNHEVSCNSTSYIIFQWFLDELNYHNALRKVLVIEKGKFANFIPVFHAVHAGNSVNLSREACIKLQNDA